MLFTQNQVFLIAFSPGFVANWTPKMTTFHVVQFNSIQFKSLFIRSKDKNTYLMLQVNIKNTLVKFTSY
jgi:hypothetical protein